MGKIANTDIALYTGFINQWLSKKGKKITVKKSGSGNAYSIELHNNNTGKTTTIATGLSKKEVFNLLVFGTNMLYEYKGGK